MQKSRNSQAKTPDAFGIRKARPGERPPVRPSGPKQDGGTPTKDPPKRGPLIAARAGSEAVAVVPPDARHGEPTTTDGERRPLPGARNQQVARPRTVARTGSRAQGRFRAVAARPGARIVGRFF
ncbi:MAG: hypothetical protein COX52_00065, partial [Syntrophobacterales bacterium CG23_combo_of_CG06-09_8_20_14_all_48_27]